MTQAPPPYVDSRRFGESTVTIICDGFFYWAPEIQAPEPEWRAAMPEANADGELKIDLNVGFVQIGGAALLIDTGYGEASEEGRRDPRSRRSPGVVAGLASLGVRPEDVTHVLITHAHGDHFEGVTVERNGERVPTFPRAGYYLHQADWLGHPRRHQPGSLHVQHFGTLERLGRLDLLAGDREIVPGVTMIHAPGESPGHCVVQVQSGSQRFYQLGDLFHHPCEVQHVDWVSRGRDQPVGRASRERLIADAVSSEATLVFSHHRFPAWGHLVRAENGFRWQDG